MRKLGFAITVGALLASTSAFAQSAPPSISSVNTSAQSYVAPHSVFEGTPFGPGDQLIPATGGQRFDGTGALFAPRGAIQYDSFVDTTSQPGFITFESSNAAGAFSPTAANITAISTSTVQIGIVNGGGLTVESTITPAGMGFYIANVGDGTCITTGTCQQVAPNSPFTFEAFGAAANSGFAEVGFDFSITTTALLGELTATRTLYSLSGSLGLGYDGGLIIFNNLAAADDDLLGFQRDTPLPSALFPGYHSHGFSWNATAVPFGDVGLFDASFQTLTYNTSVYSHTDAPCLTIGGETACLIAYSGFGDPIGAGDVIAESLGGVGVFNHGANDLITGLNFTPFTVAAPRIVGNTLEVFAGTQAVPEPSTWAMMIIGFGTIGALVRRRREQPGHA